MTNPKTDTELSAWLGEVLQPEKKCRYCWYFTKPSCDYGLGNCRNIHGRGMTDCERKPCKYYQKTPIPLDDWNVAMKIVREFSQGKITIALMEIFSSEKDNGELVSRDEHWIRYCKWLVNEAQPRDYLIAAATLKEKSNAR